MIELFFGPILSSMIPIGRAATLFTTTEIVKARLSWVIDKGALVSITLARCRPAEERAHRLPASPALRRLDQSS